MKDENESGDLEVVVGDDSTLNISEVNDCVNTLRPQDLSKEKKKVIIPVEKKKKKKHK